jgi:ABC-type uncharacterized transport system permease subunit
MLDWLDVLRYAAPVGLAAQGEAVAQRAGVLGIGLEGTMLAAAYAGMEATSRTGSPWAGLLAAVATGVLVALATAVFTVGLGVDQVVAGTAVNLGALGATSSAFQAAYGKSGQLLSVPTLPVWAPGIDPGTVAMLASPLLLAWVLRRTRAGLVVRAVGEYPKAVESAGYSALLARTGAVALGGAFAGFAGGYLAVGLVGTFVENMTAGRGFVAIAMVTFGRLRPMWVLGASLLVGVVEHLQFSLQGSGSPLPPQLFVALPYLVALAVLVLSGRGGGMPAALGVPYRRSA